ncbi:MAG: fibrobacter succinogenes major paralogous domain-containing protein [Bacteroidales bacterium]|jgi:uncharacterized protein (TIGR02145 family)
MKTKTEILIYPLAIIGVLLMLTSSCYKAGSSFDLNPNPNINPSTIPDTVTDIDGNIYNTVIIGNQVWMKENLRVTHYRNGDPIPNITDSSQWIILTTGAYCNYANNPNIIGGYGRLYNWYTVHDTRNISPSGWHVATDDEWKTLSNYLGVNDGGQLKEAGFTHWFSPNTGATNSSGFTALPAGCRTSDGSYNESGYHTYWWTSTEYSDNSGAWCRRIDYNFNQVQLMAMIKYYGLSVRCVRDYY